MQVVIVRYCLAPCVQYLGRFLDLRVVEVEAGESTGMAVYILVEDEGKLSTGLLVQEEVGLVEAGKYCASDLISPSEAAWHDIRVCWYLLA